MKRLLAPMHALFLSLLALVWLAVDSHAAVKASSSTSNSPLITNQPKSLTVYRGEGATFTVGVTGLEPFTYQWFKDLAKITDATNSIYSAPTLDRAESGKYSLVITDAAGSTTTSNPADLTVIDPRPTSISIHPSIDTSIFSSGVNPRGNATILAGTRRNGVRDRGLLRFDLPVIPTNAVIDTIVLGLTVVMAPGSPADSTFYLHRILRPWDNDANWKDTSRNLRWSTPGGAPDLDYLAAGTPGEFLFGSGIY